MSNWSSALIGAHDVTAGERLGHSGYDAVVVVSFGGPEAPEDVEPFLDRVLQGRSVPPQRRAAVAAHYHHFGGRSPINDCNRALVAALEAELAAHGHDLAVYWGNRNWHPLLAHTMAAMAGDGVRRALAFVTSAYASYSGCHQYLDDIASARAEVGDRAPVVAKLRVFYNHPGFVAANADALRAAWAELGDDLAPVVFTAHSIPVSQAANCDYEAQLRTTAGLVYDAARGGFGPGGGSTGGGAAGPGSAGGGWSIAFQSRSGPASVPWLEPDIGERLAALAVDGPAGRAGAVVVAPIGFVADHMEVVYDLDVETAALCAELKLTMVRAATAGTHPAFVRMIRQLIEERVDPSATKLALGPAGPYHDVCWPECCPPAR